MKRKYRIVKVIRDGKPAFRVDRMFMLFWLIPLFWNTELDYNGHLDSYYVELLFAELAGARQHLDNLKSEKARMRMSKLEVTETVIETVKI